jgi:hypothetical protein
MNVQHVQVEEPPARNREEEKRGIKRQIPKFNTAITVINDIQPFLKIGKVFKDNYSHRTTIVMHAVSKTFAEKDVGLEFFPGVGDPSELMASMVKNTGLIPKMEIVQADEIGQRRVPMHELCQGFGELA